MKAILVCFVASLIATTSQAYCAEGTRPSPTDLKALSDADLRDAVEKGSRETWEPYLLEIVRRGGLPWESFLKERIRANEAAISEKARKEDKDGFHWLGGRNDLELVTALRRVQKKPDPLMILVAGELSARCEFNHLPSFLVLLTNLDTDKQNIGIQSGGDYRSGRQARWRFDVRSADGSAVPVMRSLGLTIGGGLFSYSDLKYGESWVTRLEMSSFVAALPPGEYTVRILYHDFKKIAEEEDCKGLVGFSSLPLKLTVTPIELEIPRDKQAEIKQLVGQVPKDACVKIWAGDYDEQAKEFIAADTVQGKILVAGLAAVPDLIKVAVDP